MVELAFSAFSHFIIADCLFRGEFLFDASRLKKPEWTNKSCRHRHRRRRRRRHRGMI